jgi:UDP-glucose 4-epimerase
VAILKILVTAADSFLGRNLIESLIREDDVVVGLSRRHGLIPRPLRENESNVMFWGGNLTNPANIEYIYKAFQPDLIYHLAAKSSQSSDDPEDTFLNNVISTRHLIEMAPEGCRFVFSSSSNVYGDSQHDWGLGFIESDPLRPTNLYGCSKAACENLVNTYTSLGKIRGTSIRFSAIVGKGATHGALPAIIKKVKSNSEFVELIGKSPGSRKSYLSVEKAVEVLQKVASYPKARNVYNAGGCGTVSILEIYNRINAIENDQESAAKRLKWSGSYWKGDNIFSLLDNYLIEYDLNIGIDSSSEYIQKAIEDIIKE